MAADLGYSNEFNHEFWKKFRTAVKEANPEALILAEHYGDPREWLQGDEWDTVNELRCVHGAAHMVLYRNGEA